MLHGQHGKGLLSGSGPRGVAPETGFAGAPNVSEDEQADYDQFMDSGFKLIYDENALPQLLKRLTQAGNPVEGLATVTVGVVRRIVDAAEKAGQTINPDVLLEGGADLIADIAQLAKTAGVHDYTDEEIENALYAALDQYGTQEVERGAVDKEAVGGNLQAMMQADQEGRFDELAPPVPGPGAV